MDVLDGAQNRSSKVPSPPVIGVTTRRLEIEDRPLDVAEHEYSEAIALAGGLPHLLPRTSRDLCSKTLNRVDGLLLTGGGDVDPGRYRATPTDQVGGIDVDRDAYEIELVRVALERRLPLLGICRGCQVINVAVGGTLHQHLPDVTTRPHLIPSPRDRVTHEVVIEPGSQLAGALGTRLTQVNSIHHQAVDRCGGPLRAVAWSPDGIIEGVEWHHRAVLGVQWHPEDLPTYPSQRALFGWLVQRALEHREEMGTSDELPCPYVGVDHG